MKLVRKSIFSMIFLIFVFSLSAQTKTSVDISENSSIIQDRKLADYDYGGESSTCEYIALTEVKKCELSRNQARDFIWKHWKAKKRGYIIITRAGIDYANKFHLFIEPHKNGDWHIVARWKRLYGIDAFTKEEIYEKEVISLNRKRATKNDKFFAIDTFYLQFLGNDGNKFLTL